MMNKFTYQAINVSGKIFKGIIEGEDKQSVLLTLKKRKLYPIDISPIRKITLSLDFLDEWKKISNKEVFAFITQLSTMIKSGMSLIHSFEIIINQIKNVKFKKILLQIKSAIERGKSLSEASLQYSEVFSPLFSNIVRAGEESGKLELVLDRYADSMQKKNKISSEIKSALAYPAILTILSIALMIFLTTFIVPNYADLLKSSGTELPGSTQFLLSFSSFMKANYHYVLLSIFLFIIAFVKFIKTDRGSYYFDVIKLKIPIFGKIIFKTIISRFVRTMSTLLTSGVPFLRNLKLAINVINNKSIVKKLEPTVDNISKGDRVAKQFEKTGIFSPIVIQMITIGENSGTLDKMFDQIADECDREVETSIKRLSTALEPIVLILVASFIGFIAVSLVSSMMKAVNTFK